MKKYLTILYITISVIASMNFTFGGELGFSYDKMLLINSTLDSTITSDENLSQNIITNKKYTGRAMLYSGLLPGLGEYYTGAWKRGLVFAGIEIAAWMSWSKFEKKGDDASDDYELYADDHWEFSRWVANHDNWEGDTLFQSMFSKNIADEGDEPLYLYEDIWEGSHSIEIAYTVYEDGIEKIKLLDTNSKSGTGSSDSYLFEELFYDGFLFEQNGIQYNFVNMSDEQIACYIGEYECDPSLISEYFETDPNFQVIKDNTYYENVGKYNSFFAGWDDHDSIRVFINRGVEVAESPNKWIYRGMRKDANDYYKTAQYMVSTIMLNHVASMLDAVLTAKIWNDKVDANITASTKFDHRKKYGVGDVQVGISFNW
ncbi:MAG: hypothetical protein HN967_04710 [Candidatus Marinimicrobia bacterium]|nr:hypothetical protein [Candidatus Neomarinimicrobiota bacterium]